MTRLQSHPPTPEGARPPRSVDLHDRAQEVLSAAADGEQIDDLELRAARRHAEACARCSAFARAMESLPGRGGVGAPTSRVVLGAPPSPVRWALGLFGALNVTLGLPLVVGVDPFDAATVDAGHLTRDGALAVILGVVALACAHQPRIGRSLAPIAGAIVALHLVGGGSDVAEGSVTWAFEATHLLNAFTAGLVVAAALWSRPRQVGP